MAVDPQEPDEILIMCATLQPGLLDNDLINTAHITQVVFLFRQWLINRLVPLEDGRMFQIDQVDSYSDMTIRAHARRVQHQVAPHEDAPQKIELVLMDFGHIESGTFLPRATAESLVGDLVGKMTRYMGHDYTIRATRLDAGEKGNVYGECERVEVAE